MSRWSSWCCAIRIPVVRRLSSCGYVFPHIAYLLPECIQENGSFAIDDGT
jgi:hypothetical protein